MIHEQREMLQRSVGIIEGIADSADIAQEIFADLDKALGELAMKYSDEGLNDYFGVCEVILTKVIYPIKKKYTVTSTNIATPID